MIFGEHQENTLAQFEQVKARAKRAALMADGHLGYVMPIGGVAAYDNEVSVVGVGYDIACGNCAIKTDMRVEHVPTRKMWEAIASEIQEMIAFGVGRKNRSDDAPVDDPLFLDSAWWALPPSVMGSLMSKAREQLGTVGSGNHYVDVFADEEGWIWVGVHFGSRGFGHTIASGFMALAQDQQWGARVPEVETILSLDSQLGHDYWGLMNLAGRYAYVGREWVARKVVNLLGGAETELVHNHHNFAWKENHFDDDRSCEMREVIVVRKGATPAFPGQLGFVGGSMGDNSVILEGARYGTTENKTQEAALYSTVHGAGRVMSRTQAAGKINRKTGEVKSPGLISQQMLDEWLTPLGVILRGGGLDEAPQAYRRLPDVLAAQGDTITVLHELTPLIVVMAGAKEYDPYKD